MFVLSKKTCLIELRGLLGVSCWCITGMVFYDRMAPVEKLKAAVTQMFIDIATCEYAVRNGTKDGKWRNWATNALIGALYLGQCNSRPGPWQHFNVPTFEHMEAEEVDYWLSIKGVKLSRKKGCRATYVAPGIMAAIRFYRKIPGATGDRLWLFLQIRMDSRLKDTVAAYLPGYFLPNPTDVRIWWATFADQHDVELADKLDKLEKDMSLALDNGTRCRRKHYTKGKAYKVAKASKKLSMAVFGEERCLVELFVAVEIKPLLIAC